MMPSLKTLSTLSATLLVALIVLCVSWEMWLAPVRPGGSWMVLKGALLLLPLFGILRGRRYTYQWTSMFILLYLTEGVVRAGDPGVGGTLALIEAILSGLLFVSVVLYARNSAPSRTA
ncbi:MAG: DUF2069 domain-containing protein [Rhodocyclaceae bacterium]|nr:DUF2069 domain-containing protein [Rhodocyclaceae bacterium]